MAAIGIAQNNKVATSLINAPPQCASVTLNCRMEHTGAMSFGNLNRAVAGTVVCNHYFAHDSGCLKSSVGFIDAGSQRPLFIEARNYNGHFGTSARGHRLSVPGRFRSRADVGNSVHDLPKKNPIAYTTS